MILKLYTKLQTKIDNTKKLRLEKNPSQLGIFVVIKLFLLGILISLLKLGAIVFRGSVESFRILSNRSPGNKTYKYSYFEYKIFQRKARALIGIIIFAFIIAVGIRGVIKNEVIRSFILSKFQPEKIPDGHAYNVTVGDVTKTTVIISWSTTGKSYTYVEYGQNEQYGRIQGHEDVDAEHIQHSVAITNLIPNTLYHFRIMEKKRDGSVIPISEDYKFSTSSFPQIINERVKKIDETSARIVFETNLPATVTVLYRPVGRAVNYKSYEQRKEHNVYEKKHEIILDNLEYAITYDIILKAKDNEGNETEKQLPTFTASIDRDPPLLSGFKIESSLISRSSGLVQTIVSWKTDELSTSQVTYQEGINLNLVENNENGRALLQEKTREDLIMTKDHAMVIMNLKTNTTYQFRAISKDNSQNQAISRDQVVYTPKKKQSIVEIVGQIIQDAFK